MIRAWLEKYLLMAATSRVEIYKSSTKIKQTFYNNSALMLRKVFLVSYLQFGAHLCWVMKPWDACRGFSSAPLNRNTIGWVKVSLDVAIILRISSITTTIAPSSPEPNKCTIAVEIAEVFATHCIRITWTSWFGIKVTIYQQVVLRCWWFTA